ncbi:MAG: ATP-binding protein [Limisphaerales bacterium]
MSCGCRQCQVVHIDGFAEMLQQTSAKTLDASGQRYLGIISDSAKRMGTLIDDLLVFSRMGRSEMRRTDVNMDEMVAETLRDMASDLKDRKIKWDIEPLPMVNVDRPMLKQVWVNLLSNAVKYTRHREEAEIKVRCRKNDSGDFEFSVYDNGAGFDMQYAHKLFGVFQRLHLNEEFEGTGIGLANVRRIILRHGGRTWAEGKIDAGATFYFTLPNKTPARKE